MTFKEIDAPCISEGCLYGSLFSVTILLESHWSRLTLVDDLAAFIKKLNIRMSLTKKTVTRRANRKKQLDTSVFDLHHRDARELLEVVLPDTVDVTITSPPYFDLKDYGSENQIGHGQSYIKYLHELKEIFQKVHVVTKQNGSLWIIIDTFRRDQELVALPFDLAAELKKVGWSLKDVIIWKKERTVPWSQSGATRNIFEYILVFAKDGEIHQYFADRQREIHDLKHWWVKYPERYNQKGKSLEEIWTFDIPTQGSWGTKHINHFCPLPEGLVQRIIDLTTNIGQTVLDPFAGSGTVPAQAHFMSRKFIGFELNSIYIDGFRKNLILINEKNNYVQDEEKRILFRNFEEKIIALRLLKLGRILFKELKKEYTKTLNYVLVEKLELSSLGKFKISSGKFTFFINPNASDESFLAKANSLLSIPPFSKFGIEAEIISCNTTEDIVRRLEQQEVIYCYSTTNSHQVKIEAHSPSDINNKAPILSNIYIDINENDFK